MNAFEYDVEDYLTYLAAHGYASTTVRGRRYHLNELSRYLEARGITDPRKVTPAALESYQRHLFHHKKRDGTALSFATQAQRLVPVKSFFSFLVKTGASNFDPALSLTLPKTERRLPEAVLSVDEVEAVLTEPDTTTPLGLRDRAILEVFYSTAIRRMELINLHVGDIDVERGSLFVRQGKGARDRFVPIGGRACYWVTRYLQEVRPQLQRDNRQITLFLSSTGLSLASDVMTRLVGAYIRSGTGTKRGSCHLFRHTTATLMLDAGADVRHVAEMLGHQNLETTMQYTRVSMAKLQEVHARCHPAERKTSRAPWGPLVVLSSQMPRGVSRMEHVESELRLNSRLGALVLEHRDALLAISARHHAKNVRIFGSVVRGEDSSSSDVDFLVEFEEDAHPLDILALGCDLEEELGVKVDVCTPNGLRSVVRDEVFAEAVPL